MKSYTRNIYRGTFADRPHATVTDDVDDYPTSDGIYIPKPTVPEDPPRDDDSYGKEVANG